MLMLAAVTTVQRKEPMHDIVTTNLNNVDIKHLYIFRYYFSFLFRGCLGLLSLLFSDSI